MNAVTIIIVANVYAGFVTRIYIIILYYTYVYNVNMYNTVSWMSTILC